MTKEYLSLDLSASSIKRLQNLSTKSIHAAGVPCAYHSPAGVPCGNVYAPASAHCG
ncbi:MAG: hypothetical protein J7545_22540 [Roseofilum sp. SBFL]|uniref:hypothetical protein n=1 Tax=unclassified Roseofilum TaxID=2620099 RepID=UPI001B2A4355|nr:MULTISPECIES: hypothetical protein [unclassified Roseofilum]MBP0011996.1 hypothetical protein [Roseofilum sp. SID3]MBP0022997.1 hypothetical protein [Roseofilum sp. SID2]MBP0037494.1 hypothetical protein [Roseofilum sp. SID1]MBP0044717.1 hypothetical protein [Roseofilum sp. SBFL]